MNFFSGFKSNGGNILNQNQNDVNLAESIKNSSPDLIKNFISDFEQHGYILDIDLLKNHLYKIRLSSECKEYINDIMNDPENNIKLEKKLEMLLSTIYPDRIQIKGDLTIVHPSKGKPRNDRKNKVSGKSNRSKTNRNTIASKSVINEDNISSTENKTSIDSSGSENEIYVTFDEDKFFDNANHEDTVYCVMKKDVASILTFFYLENSRMLYIGKVPVSIIIHEFVDYLNSRLQGGLELGTFPLNELMKISKSGINESSFGIQFISFVMNDKHRFTTTS